MDLRLPDPPTTTPQAKISSQASALSVPAGLGERVLLYQSLWSLAMAAFCLDQLTKIWIATHLAYPTYWPREGAITVVEDHFYLVHVGNTGAAWSLFAGQSSFLALMAGVTLLAVYIWRRQLGLRHRRVQTAFGLLCGGIAGNFFDRILHGHVIDFLDFHFGSYIFPTFNFADVSICAGVLLYLWHTFREPIEP